MKRIKAKLPLMISALVSLNLVMGALPAQAEERPLRDIRGTEYCSPGLNRTYEDLSYMDFSGCDLSNGNFAYTNLTGSVFRDSNLSGSNLVGAITNDVDFTRANLSLTDIRITDINGRFESANFSGAHLENARLNGDFDSSYLTDVITDGNTRFNGSFNGADFTSSWIYGAHLSGSFHQAIFTNTRLDYSRLDGSFDGSDFNGANLIYASLVGSFAGAKFRKVVEGSSVEYLMEFTVFMNDGFQGATFENVYFSQAVMNEADLREARFSGQMKFWGSYPPTKLPSGWTFCGEFIGPNLDLSGHFIMQQIAGCDFTAVDWTGSNVTSSTFYKINFQNANLGGLNFNHNVFQQVTFSNSNLSRRFDSMRFLDVRFENSNLRGSSFERTEIIGADFSGASLEGVSFAGANLNNVSFKGANLNGVNFSGAILTNIDFSGANLEAARFGSALAYQMYNLDCQNSTGINLQFSALHNSSLYNCHFESLKLTGYSNTWFYSSDFKDVQFDGTGTNASLYFSGGELSDVYFVHPNGGGLNFSGTKLRNLRFDSASNFYGSIFDSVTLDNVQLAGDFTQSTFSNSDMRAFQFSTKCLSCKFINIDARQSNFSSLQFGNNLYFKSSNLAEANFSNLILTSLTLENVNIEKSDFSGTQLPNLINKGGVSGTPINLDKRFLIRGGLILGPTVTLYELDLTNFDFANVDLRGAFIGFSNISGAKFALAKSVFGLNSRELSGQPANLRSGTALFNGRFVGPGAYLDSGDFHGFDFGQVDLSFSFFTDAKLQGANLYQANVLGASICGAVTDSSTLAPKNTSFITSLSNNRSYLVGSGLQHCSDKATSFGWAEWYTPGMTFSGRSFEKANFRGIYLQFVDFSGSNLRGANLTDARLFGADLSGADLRGATLAGSNLAGATLDGALLTNIQGAPEYLPSGWAFSNGSIVREGSQISGMNITNSRCAAGNESMAIDSQTHLTLVGDASYASTLSMDTTQGVNAKGSCMVWFIDGAVVSSATKLTYSLGKSDIGKKVRVGVVRTDLSGTKTIQLSDELMVGKAKMNSVAPTVTGISKVGGRLTALRTTWAPGATYTYQWFRSGEAISGATKASYLPSADDHQHGLSVKVCASKAYFETRCETSSASSPIEAGGFPKSPVVQLVVGKLTVGSILTGKPGNWLAGTSLSFQWLRDGVAIKDATLTSYTLSSEDRGHVIQFQVTASKRGYIDQVKSSISKSIP